MEKTVQITIASTQFQVTESAYNVLRSYLDRLTAHFGDTLDGAEIIRDIESRIAEKLIDAKHKLVTEKDVAAVIAEIGDTSAFSDDAKSEPGADEPKEKIGRKRLYRDMDNAYLGGVASGIAAYFNIDPLWIRLAFLISIFSGGAGIVLYLILWFLIPEAKSASQKLEMSGRPVNLDTIAGIVKDRFDEAETSGAFARGAHAIDSFARRVFGYIGSVIGAFLSLGSFFAIIAASVLLGVVMFNWNASWNDLPHKEVISPMLLQTALIVAYTAIVIPLVFIFSLGYRWMMRRTILTATIGFGLVGIWALSLVACGVLGTKIAGDYYAYTASSPEYAQTVDERALDAFSAISVQNANVTVRSGNAYAVQISGKKIDMDNVSLAVTDGVLNVTSLPHHGPCLFCSRSMPSVTVTVPALESISARSSSVSLDALSLPSLSIDAQNANLSGSGTIPRITISARSSWAGLELSSASVSLDAKSSRIRLEGTTDTISITARSSFVDAESFVAAEASVSAQSSSVQVRAEKSFQILNEDSSDVQNAGTGAGVSESNAETN